MQNIKIKREKVKNDEQFNWIANLFSALSWLPLVTVISLLTFYILTALEVGHLPTYGNPDPKFQTFSPMMNIIFVGILLSIASIPIWIGLAKAFHTYFTPKQWWFNSAVYSLSIVAFLFINFATPIMEWFID